MTDHTEGSAVLDHAAAAVDALLYALLDAHKCRGAYCAACCYGTGLLATCQEEQDILDAAVALARALRRMRKPHEKGA